MTLALNGMSLERRYGVAADPLQRLEINPFLRGVHSLLASDPRCSAFEQVGVECHFRYDFANFFGAGQVEICSVSEGMFLQLADAESSRPLVVHCTFPDGLRIRIASEGIEAFAPNNEGLTIADGPSSLIVIEPADQPPSQIAFAGRQRSVHLYADRHALQAFCRDREGELPAVLRKFLDGTLQDTFVKRGALKPEALRCLGRRARPRRRRSCRARRARAPRRARAVAWRRPRRRDRGRTRRGSRPPIARAGRSNDRHRPP